MSELTQCEFFDGMSNTRCCFHAGHSGDHFCSREDESDRIRWKIAADERDRLSTLLAERDAEIERLRELNGVHAEGHWDALKMFDDIKEAHDAMKGCDCQGVGHTPWCRADDRVFKAKTEGDLARAALDAMNREYEKQSKQLAERDAEVGRLKADRESAADEYVKLHDIATGRLQGLIKQRDSALTEVERMRAVFEAAVEWRDTWRHRHPFGEESKAVALVDAIDAATKAGAQ